MYKRILENNTNNRQNAEFATRHIRQVSVIRKRFSRYIFSSSKGGRLSDSHCSLSWTASRLKAWPALFFLSELRTRKMLLARVLRREKPVCITKRPASNPPTYHAYLRLALRRSFPLASSRRLFPLRVSSSNRLLRMLPVGPDALLSRGFVHRAGSPFFQILHILSTSAYAALNFGAVSETSHATLPLSRDVSLPFTAFRFPLTISKRVHNNFSIFKEKLMKSTIFFWSPYVYFNLYRSSPRGQKALL